MALNKKNLVVFIPANSKLLDRFRKPDGTGTGFWEFEIQASPNLTAPPLIAVKRATMPPGLERKRGLTKGVPHKNGGWLLAIKRTQVPALSNMIDSISSVDVELKSDNAKEIVFKLPAGTVPTGYHPHNDTLVQEPKPSVAEQPEEPEVAKPTVEPQAGYQDKPIVLQMPKQSVSVEQAIGLLNKRKLQLGNKLRFTITEDGFLTAFHRID